MAIIINSTKNASSHGVKILVYGQSGAGKSYLTSTLPGKTLILSAESGLLSLRSFDIDTATIKDMADLKDAFELVAGTDKYNNVVLDSLTEIAENILDVESAKKTKSGEPVGLAAYNELYKQVKRICKNFRDLEGKNVIFTALVEREKDELSGAVLLFPLLPGKKLQGEVPALFDEVFYLTTATDKETGEVTRWLQTQRDNKVMAKDRSGSLEMFEAADLTAIFKKINATKGETKKGA
jgi:phage nucleotide-binding protein